MESILSASETYVSHFFTDNLPSEFLYHNLAHTKRVVSKTIELAEVIGVSETESYQLQIAAWFHDIGYIKSKDAHEKASVELAAAFLQEHNLPKADIDIISQLILATEMHYEPVTQLEKIIRDADASHLGSKNYFDVSELLRKEWELTLEKHLTEEEWIELNIGFLTKHRFYTVAAATAFEKTKGKNLAQLIKSLKKIKGESQKQKQKKEELKLKKNKGTLPERGIETMFRVALRNHITLSDIADTKANILLSVNAIIISVALSNLLPKLDNPSNTYLIIPTLIFMAFTVTSIVLSVLATRPNITQGKFTKEDVANKKVNLLFFGNFHQMKLNEFEWAMDEMMKDRDYLYGSLTKDLYFLGLVLNRKYSLLRTTY